FGDGSDGDATISVDTIMARDMYYNNLTVNAGKVLNTDGLRLFVKGTLTNRGTIENNGFDAVADAHGFGADAQTTAGGKNGGSGVSLAVGAGDNGVGTASGLGGAGGAGGDASGGQLGGTGGAVSNPSTAPKLRDQSALTFWGESWAASAG